MSKLAFSSLAMLFLLCAPALAQSSPSASQYESCDPASETCASSVNGSVEDVVDNAEKGTSAVNEAMDDAIDGTAQATASASAVSASASSSAESDAGGEEAAGPDGITKLPETGGASLAVLGSGVVLAALGLMSRKVVGR